MARRIFKRSKKTNSCAGKIAHRITEVDGIKFHSAMESKRYQDLKKLKADGIIKDFELQPKFLLQEKFIVVDGQVIKGSHEDFNKLKRKTKAKTIASIEYIADFKITYADGSVVIEDTKGLSTPEFELKKKMFMLMYPELPLSIIIDDEKGLIAKNEWVDFYEYRAKERALKREKNKAKKLKEMGKGEN